MILDHKETSKLEQKDNLNVKVVTIRSLNDQELYQHKLLISMDTLNTRDIESTVNLRKWQLSTMIRHKI